jgi:hypothetical protein
MSLFYAILRAIGLKRTPDYSKMSVEELMEFFEETVRQKMHRESHSISFWGELRVDPNKVYVSREDAERSRKVLENLVAKRAS